MTIAAVVTAVKRQISKKTGKEYARLTLEDFHGTAEALVFPDAWARLNQVIRDDAPMLLTGGYSAPRPGRGPGALRRSRRPAPLDDLRPPARWGCASAGRPRSRPAEGVRPPWPSAPGTPAPSPLYIEWSDGNGESPARCAPAGSACCRTTICSAALRDLLRAPTRFDSVKAG